MPPRLTPLEAPDDEPRPPISAGSAGAIVTGTWLRRHPGIRAARRRRD